MNVKTILDELAAALATEMGSPWNGYRSQFAQRTALHPPFVMLRNFRVKYFHSHGLHLVTVEAAFAASGTDVAAADDAVFSVLSTGDDGKADALVAVTPATPGLWTDLAAETGAIDDQLLIGQQTYRAAVLPLEFLTPDELP